MLEYKRLVLSRLVKWKLPHLFAVFFLLFIVYLEPTPFRVKTKTVCSVTPNYRPFPRAITQDYKNSYNAFNKEGKTAASLFGKQKL